MAAPNPNPRKDYGMFALARHLASDDDHGLVAQAILEFDGGPNQCIFGWLPPSAADEPPPSFTHQARSLDYALSLLEYGRFVPDPYAGPFHAAMGIPALLLGARAQRDYPHNPGGPARFFTPASNYLSYLVTTAPRGKSNALGTLGLQRTVFLQAASLFSIPPFLAHCSTTLPSPATPITSALLRIEETVRALRVNNTTSLLLDSTCTVCDAHRGSTTNCRCLRRPSAIAAALAVAGMLRVHALLARQNEADRRARVRVGRTVLTNPEAARIVAADNLLRDLRALLRAANPPRLWAPFTTRETLVRTLLDEPCAPPDVAATALLVASALNLKMLVPAAVSEEEVQWAERQFAVVMDWVRGLRVEMRATEEPQCLTPCCVLMMMGAGRNPLLVAIMRRERMLPPVFGQRI
ncbi:hypothetical protein C8A05DRAFT_34962 [Staphylotrichum tortipilum]|uniref:Uncharacterized protein n=1 Tax=Staphylotrichum tortipilum TaxID=2831512 RepID=A0AAN6MK56_9PEZI|nr:hypothetical protein C8A05DRAFT_34962 [Staphylotrichum longicolle]